MTINVTKIPYAQRVDGFCKENPSKQDHRTSGLVETEDGVLLRVSTDDEENLQILTLKLLRPRLLKLTHPFKTARHPEKKRMYARLKNRVNLPHTAADIAMKIKSCAPCASNLLESRKRGNPISCPRWRSSRLCRFRHPGATLQVANRKEIPPGNY